MIKTMKPTKCFCFLTLFFFCLTGCSLIETFSTGDSSDQLATAKMIARKAGKYIARNNPEKAKVTITAYARLQTVEEDIFREAFFTGLQNLLESEGIKGVEELRQDAAELLAIFGYDINLTVINLPFLEEFSIQVIREISDAFIQGMTTELSKGF